MDFYLTASPSLFPCIEITWNLIQNSFLESANTTLFRRAFLLDIFNIGQRAFVSNSSGSKCDTTRKKLLVHPPKGSCTKTPRCTSRKRPGGNHGKQMVSMVLAKRRKQNTRTIDHYSCKVRQL
jgi:hypothetical protein